MSAVLRRMVPARCAMVKSSGVVCDGRRVIFLVGQALSAGIVLAVATSSVLGLVLWVVSGTVVRRARARTSRPR